MIFERKGYIQQIANAAGGEHVVPRGSRRRECRVRIGRKLVDQNGSLAIRREHLPMASAYGGEGRRFLIAKYNV